MGVDRSLVGGVAACAMAMALSVAPEVRADETTALDEIQRYCTTSWRNAGIAPQDWSDCTQQAFVQLLGRVERPKLGTALDDSNSAERRELNRSIWSTIQRWRRRHRYQSLDATLLADRQPASVMTETQDLSSEQAELLGQALAQVSPRQRQILLLWSQGTHIRDIATRLDLSRARASDEKYKALRILKRWFDQADGQPI